MLICLLYFFLVQNSIHAYFLHEHASLLYQSIYIFGYFSYTFQWIFLKREYRERREHRRMFSKSSLRYFPGQLAGLENQSKPGGRTRISPAVAAQTGAAFLAEWQGDAAQGRVWNFGWS